MLRHLAAIFFATVCFAGLADAGSWTYENLGPGNEPNTYRVRVTVDANLEGQCTTHTCAWCCGGHEMQISPAPVWAGLFTQPNEDGVFGSLEWGNPGGGGTIELELDPAQTYTLSQGRSWDALLAFEQGGTCTTTDLCVAEDTAFEPLEIVGPAVPTAGVSWSTLRAMY